MHGRLLRGFARLARGADLVGRASEPGPRPLTASGHAEATSHETGHLDIGGGRVGAAPVEELP
eukprot:1530755-Pyramimonas_sp.AAC.1